MKPLDPVEAAMRDLAAAGDPTTKGLIKSETAHHYRVLPPTLDNADVRVVDGVPLFDLTEMVKSVEHIGAQHLRRASMRIRIGQHAVMGSAIVRRTAEGFAPVDRIDKAKYTRREPKPGGGYRYYYSDQNHPRSKQSKHAETAEKLNHAKSALDHHKKAQKAKTTAEYHHHTAMVEHHNAMHSHQQYADLAERARSNGKDKIAANMQAKADKHKAEADQHKAEADKHKSESGGGDAAAPKAYSSAEHLDAAPAGTVIASTEKKGRAPKYLARKNHDGTWDIALGGGKKKMQDFANGHTRGINERTPAKGVLFRGDSWTHFSGGPAKKSEDNGDLIKAKYTRREPKPGGGYRYYYGDQHSVHKDGSKWRAVFHDGDEEHHIGKRGHHHKTSLGSVTASEHKSKKEAEKAISAHQAKQTEAYKQHGNLSDHRVQTFLQNQIAKMPNRGGAKGEKMWGALQDMIGGATPEEVKKQRGEKVYATLQTAADRAMSRGFTWYGTRVGGEAKKSIQMPGGMVIAPEGDDYFSKAQDHRSEVTGFARRLPASEMYHPTGTPVKLHRNAAGRLVNPKTGMSASDDD